MQSDIALTNEVNTKWAPTTADKIERKMRQIDRGMLVAPSDSKQWDVIKNTHLPGG